MVDPMGDTEGMEIVLEEFLEDEEEPAPDLDCDGELES